MNLVIAYRKDVADWFNRNQEKPWSLNEWKFINRPEYLRGYFNATVYILAEPRYSPTEWQRRDRGEMLYILSTLRGVEIKRITLP